MKHVDMSSQIWDANICVLCMSTKLLLCMIIRTYYYENICVLCMNTRTYYYANISGLQLEVIGAGVPLGPLP